MLKLNKYPTFLISRTDSIGDVVLTLPLAGYLKEKFPGSKILFLGVTYTQDVVRLSQDIDKFIDWNEIKNMPKPNQIQYFKSLSIDCVINVLPNKTLAKIFKNAKIPNRIGTSHRIFHWFSCNHLVNLGRKNSNLHEAELNIELVRRIIEKNITEKLNVRDYLNIKCDYQITDNQKDVISKEKKNILLHPFSKGSSFEWGIKNFQELIELLPIKDFNVIIGGTKTEQQLYYEHIVKKYPHIIDVGGKVTLEEYIAIINNVDCVVACSTGPLHIAGILNKLTIGIYPNMRPYFPQRWSPIGQNVIVLEGNLKNTNANTKPNVDISAKQVFESINSKILKKV